MKKSVLILISTATLALPIASQAQFGGISNLLGGSKNSGGAASDLIGQQESLARNYVNAGKDVLKANDRFADALGIKAQAVDASTTSDSLSASDIESQDKAISADAKALSDALKSGATLKDTEAKVKYGQGLIALVSGIRKYTGMRADAQNFSSGLSGASPLQLPKLQAGAYIIKSLPTSVTNLTSVLKSAIDFGRSNGVEIPADATSLL